MLCYTQHSVLAGHFKVKASEEGQVQEELSDLRCSRSLLQQVPSLHLKDKSILISKVRDAQGDPNTPALLGSPVPYLAFTPFMLPRFL